MTDIEHGQYPVEVAGRSEDGRAARAVRRTPARRLFGIAILGTLVGGVIALGIGFFHFVHAVSSFEKPWIAQNADAIVALTGGADRIAGAVELLREGRAGRLLISGVHPGTTREALARLAPGRDGLFECCVDLGHSALNTVGNAKETRDWARGNGFRTLIVVTSSYHLPRSLNEIGRELPEARLIPYPVVSESSRIDHWWQSPRTVRLLLSEYAKYLMSVVRLRWGQPATAAEANRIVPDTGS